MEKLYRALWLLAVLAVMLGGRAAAQELSLAELEVDHALTCDFPTPHTDWAQPYALGKTRVLFFCGGMGTQPRECVELIQRFDLDARAVFWSQIVDTPTSHWHGGKAGEARMFQLLTQKWDCFVLFGLTLQNMHAREQYLLVRAVADGAGIVMVGGHDPRVLKPANRLNRLPRPLADPGSEAYSVGKGRGARLPRRPEIPYREGWQVEDDYWHERLGRAVLWAAGKEPRANLDLTVSQPEAAVDAENRVRIRLCGKSVGQKLMLQASVRRPADEPFAWPARELSLDQPIELALPRLPAGEYHVDARVIGSAGAEAWATVPLRVKSERTAAAIELDKDWGEIGDRIAGRVRVQGPSVAGETLRVRLLDRRRRELVRKEIERGERREERGEGKDRTAGGAKSDSKVEVAFDFAVEPWMPMLVTVEAHLRNANGEVSRASSYFRITTRRRGQFNFLMWDFPVGTLAPYAEESLVRHGVTLQLQGSPEPPWYLAAFDVGYAPYTTRIMTPLSPQRIMQPFCWNDDAAVAKHVRELAARYVPARRHGVFVYSLGDENETRGCCLSPHCLKAYRQYLKETYGDLESLNRSWGTAWKGWDEVRLTKDDDNEEAAALAQGNYPRWFDRQAFKSYNYVRYCQQYAQAYRQIDPQAKTGFEGAGGFASGDDLDLIVRSLEFWSPYPGTADEVIRSIAPRAMPRANWMGYTKDADSLLAKYWRMVTRGSDAVWWWRWDCIGAFHGWLAPDLRPYPAVKDILQDTQVVRDGLGDLLLGSEMQDDGIAVLYSFPSVFAHKLAEGGGYGGYETAHLRMHQVLRDLGFQFRYVTDRMLRLGEFRPEKYRLLILCRNEALGDREAQVIRQFVQQGGTLLADVRPGLYDEHCKPRSRGVLDDLFGVVRRPKVAARTVKSAGPLGPGKPAIFANVAADPGVTPEGPDAVAALGTAEGVPLVISRRVGKGRAMLLNFSLASHPRPGAGDAPQQSAEFFRQLLAQAGLAPALRVSGPSGKHIPNVEVIRWQNGSQEIVALFREQGQPEPAVVELAGAQPRWVCDLRHRKAFGPATEFSTVVLPNRASFFLLAGKPAPSPQLVLDRPAVQRGQLVRGRLSVPGAEGLCAFRIRVRCDDRPLEWFDRLVVVGAEPKEFDLPVAYNDPVGQYEVVAMDLLGATAAPAGLAVQ